jgi:hypothetical protein
VVVVGLVTVVAAVDVVVEDIVTTAGSL